MPKDEFGNDIIDDSDDDDILKDLFMETNDDDDTNKGTFDSEEMKALKDALAEKDKQINGLLQTVKSDRRKRQEMKGQLDQVTSTINSLLEKRQTNDDELDTGSRSGKAMEIDGIPIEFTEDGDAFVPMNKINAIISPHDQKIQEVEEALLLINQQQQQELANQRLKQQMVGEDEQYPAIYSKYQNARKWVNDRVIEHQNDNSVNGAYSSGEALTKVFRGNQQLVEEFNNLFPGFNLAQVAQAEDSEYHFEDMLKNTAKKMAEMRKPDERFRKVLQKPSGLGKSANAKGGELTLADRVNSLTATDLMKLPEKQLEALQNFLRDEEQRDGIDF